MNPYVNSWNLFYAPKERVIALPHWRNPRLYMCSRSWRQRWVDGAYYPAYRLRARGFRLILRLFATVGLCRTRTSSQDSVQYIPVPGVDNPRMVVMVGAEGPARKMIARVVDEDTSRTAAYIKYAGTAVAQENVAAEYHLLNALPHPGAGEPADKELPIAPEVIRFAPFGEGTALVVSAVEGRMLPVGLPVRWGSYQSAPLYQLLKRMPRSGRQYALDEHPVIRRLLHTVSGRFDLESVLTALRGRAWPAVVQHGDLTPWNILQRGDQSLAAIDWEEGVLEGFPYLDFIYYVLQTGYLIHGWSPERLFDYLAEAFVDEDLNRSEVNALVRLCALDAYVRFGEETGNARLQQFRKEMFAFDPVSGEDSVSP